jgi:hypothetical protein
LLEQKTFGKAKAAAAGIIILGAATLLSSTLFISSFFTIVGFSLVFWGAILLYIIPTKSNLAMLVSAVAEPASANIERILSENEFHQKGIYVPTKYIDSNSEHFRKLSKHESTESVVIFVPKASLSYDTSRGKQLAPKSGLYISPPGQALCKIFEKQMGKSFSEISLQQFTTIFPNILTSSLKLAQSVNIRIEKNIITIEIIKSLLEQICQETDKYQQTHDQVGCLLSSAIACALAKVIDKPLTINNETRNLQAKVTNTQFSYMSDF